MRNPKNLWRFLYAKECIIITLAVLSLTFLALDQFFQLSQAQQKALYVYDVTVGLIFIGEFLMELWLTTDRKGYVKSNWFYLFAAIPLPYAIAQLLRGLRIIRVVKLIKSGTHFEFEKSTKNASKT